MAWGLPLPPAFYKWAGYALMNRWQYEEAEVFFGYLQKKYPERIEGHEGLIILARKTERQDLLLERLDVAIQYFPWHLEFIGLQIKTLTTSGAAGEAKQLINRHAPRFQNDPSWAMVEATFWNEQYEYPFVKSILQAATEKHPGHLELMLMQSQNLWQLGEDRAAFKILNEVQPQLDFEKKSLPEQFTYPYIGTLIAENNLEKLQGFFEKSLAGKVSNWEIISGYSQLLTSRGNFAKAKAFIEKMIRERASELSLDKYVLLVFEHEKIKNISLALQSEKPINQSGFSNDFFSDFLNNILSQLEKHPHFPHKKNILTGIFSQLNRLSQSHPVLLNTAVSLQETYRAARHIIAQIKKSNSFSFIRLGDGEGHFLPYEND